MLSFLLRPLNTTFADLELFFQSGHVGVLTCRQQFMIVLHKVSARYCSVPGFQSFQNSIV